MIPLLRAACAATVAAAVLGLATAGDARPAGGSRIVLRTPGDTGDAIGRVVVKPRAGHRGETMRLRFRGLDGSREYLVRDRVGGELLRAIRTSPAGAGRLRLACSSPDSFGGVLIEIVDQGDGTVVLEGVDPIPDMHGDGDCTPPDGAGHNDHAMDHHDSDADHHGDPGDHDGGHHDSGGDMHGDGGHM